MHLAKFVNVVAAGSLGLSISFSLAACRGLDRTFDCSYQEDKFDAAVAKEGELLPAIADVGIFPMAMMISEEGINDLLNGVVGKKVPFASGLQLGPALVQFTPTSVPVIDVASVPGCGQCVLFSLEFEFGVDQGGEGIAAGLGEASLSIPIRMEKRDDGSAALIASYEQATVVNMDLNVNGFNSKDHDAIAGALEMLATDTIREQYGPTELLVIGTFTLGSDEVKLSASQMFVVPDYDAILFGMETNLVLPEGTGLDQPQALPEMTKMGLLFDPGLLLAVSQRMTVEGKIPRHYNDDGAPDPEGNYGVTITGMAASSIGDERLDTYFRIWRTDGDYCGFAEVEMPLFISLDTAGGKTNLAVEPGSAKVVGGEGAGKLAATNEELVMKNMGLIDSFKASLAEQVRVAINYDEIGVEGSTIIFTPLDTAVDAAAQTVNVYLDFLVVASE